MIRRVSVVVFAVLLISASAFGLRSAWEGLKGGTSQPAYAQEDCAEVASFGPETEDQITDPFQINGNTIRLTADLTSASQGLSPLLTVTLNDEQGTFSDGVVFDQEGSQTENFLVSGETPSSFTLEIEADATEYTLTVEDCGVSPTGGAPASGDDSSAETQYEDDSEPVAVPPNDDLLDAGGPTAGSMPLMPDGSCPEEFPAKRGGACYDS